MAASDFISIGILVIIGIGAYYFLSQMPATPMIMPMSMRMVMPHSTRMPKPPRNSMPSPAPTGGCNPALWDQIPAAFRSGPLKKLADCITVEGTVTWNHYCPSDGDGNFNVAVDPQYKKYILPANSKPPFTTKYQKSSGNIHCESPCMCANTSTDPVKKGMCSSNKPWPRYPRVNIGQRVRVTGTWTQDVREGGHAEIHPVHSIQII